MTPATRAREEAKQRAVSPGWKRFFRFIEEEAENLAAAANNGAEAGDQSAAPKPQAEDR